ncbi:glycosyltransferase family 9 protein [Verrucomicrobia bacterium S94]|nr:glycosyltransferase family 9 protein [Verrucomicrobia bacterium S94]
MKCRKRILIIRLKSIGDVIQTLPAVRMVRENFPDAHISFLVCRSNASLIQGFQDVDEIIEIDRSRMKRGIFAFIAELFRIIHRMINGRFSLVIDLQGYGETALLSRITGAKERWGMVYSRGRKWAYTKWANRNKHVHAIEKNIQLLTACGLKPGTIENHFVLPASSREAAKKVFISRGLDLDKPLLYIQAFTSTPSKNWPLEKYLAVAEDWRACGGQVVFGGGTADAVALAPVSAAGFEVFTGLPILVSAGLMYWSTLVLGGDTGMLHIANAMGKRAVMLIKNCHPGRADLYQHKEWVIDPSGCGSLSEIAVEKVIDTCRNGFPMSYVPGISLAV